MATKTFEELKQMAIQIRDEKTNKQNTATRIGTQMLEHLNKLEQEYYNKENIDEQKEQTDAKFSELDIKLGNNIILENIVVTPINGKAISPTGQLIFNANVSYAEIDTTDIQKIDIYTFINKSFGNVAYYDADDNVLSVAVPSNDGAVYGHVYLDKPIGAVKARVCWPTIRDYTIRVSKERFAVTSDLNRTNEKLDENNTSIDKIEKSIYTPSFKKVETSYKTDNKYLFKDGITEVDLEGFYIKSFDVRGVDVVRVTGTFFALGCALCFKDEEGNIIGDVLHTDETIEGASFTANVPKEAVMAYTSYRSGINSQEIGTSISKTDILEDRLYIKGEEINQDWTDNSSIEYINNKYVNIAGVIVDNFNGFTIANIPITSNIKSITVRGFVSNIMCGLCYKDENDSVIGDILYITGESRMETFTADIPDGASYAQTCYRTRDGHSIIVTTIKGNGNIEDIVNEHTRQIKELGQSSVDTDLIIENVNFIPIFGQSLSVGAAATPIITSVCKYKAGIMFNTGIRCPKKNVSDFTSFIPLVEQESGATVDSAGVGETVASGCMEQLIELICKEVGISPYSNYWDNHKFLFGSFGAGSTTIAMLTETPETGIGYYQGIVNAMQAAKNICDKNGWTLNIPAWIWIQGETDQKIGNNTPKSEYKQALSDLAKQFDTDAKAITGQENEVKCICYQTGSQNYWYSPLYSSTAMDVPTAQMELVRDNDMFLAANPVYMLEHSEKEKIHLSAIGEKMLGLYCGIALKSIIDKTYDKKGVTPVSYTISDNDIIIKYKAPCSPLRINTSYVKEVSNYGFTILNSDDTNIITSVSVFDTEIKITCSQSPLNCKLYYGFNGDRGYDGRLKGSRGNICDSGGYIYNGLIDKNRMVLDNYSYAFEKLLSTDSDII